ncbi:MAG: hypothetical protein OIF50_10900 [Flavobacteriaceae bacterium]|nr:hypothetical protein [Flavobacteriaceae bacterium]
MNFMKKLSIIVVICIATTLASCSNDDDNNGGGDSAKAFFAVANRASNTISYHNTEDLALLGTTNLPDGSQPTYVAYSSERDRIYTGGFGSGKLYEIDAADFSLKRTLDIGLGAFHLWLNDEVDQLWVNNVNSGVKTTTVVNLENFSVTKTIALPTTLNLSPDAVQHDVIVNPQGGYAYVTILDGDKSHLVQYRTDDFTMMSNTEIGGDGHVGFFNNWVYSLSQDAGEIKRHQPVNLQTLETLDFDGSHGVFASKNHLFVADLPGGRLGIIDGNNQLVATKKTSLVATHNLAANDEGDKLVVTYSGPMQTKIELFTVANNMLTSTATIDSGTNPFGLTYVKRK